MNRHKPGKNKTGMMLLSLLRVQDNVILPIWYEETTRLFVLTVQWMVTCTYHLSLPAAISIYGWRYQARFYCAYTNGLSCFFRLRARPFTNYFILVCVSLWETNYRNAFGKFYASFDLFITYNRLSLLASSGLKTMYIKSH